MHREWMNFSAEIGAFRTCMLYVVQCTCIATEKYCAKHWMKGDVRDLGLIQSWIMGSFSHIGSNFVIKGGFSGAADTNQALSRHPFNHALDWTLLLVLSTELQFCLRYLNARLHCKVWWSLGLLVSCFPLQSVNHVFTGCSSPVSSF